MKKLLLSICFLVLTLNSVLASNEYSLVNLKGKMIKKETFSKVRYIEKGYCFVAIGNHYAVMDSTGRVITDYTYKNVNFTTLPTLIKVQNSDEKWGAINLKGKTIVPCIYDYIGLQEDYTLKAEKDDLYGFIDTLGNELIPVTCPPFGEFGANLASAVNLKTKKEGAIDRKGNLVIPCIYNEVEACQYAGGAIAYSQNGDRKYYYIDSIGEVKISSTEKIKDLNGLLCKIIDPTTYEAQLYDYSGNPVGGVQDDMYCHEFYEGLAAVGLFHYGYINLKGELAIPRDYSTRFTMPGVFYEGRARVKKNKMGVIDKEGKVLVPFVYDDILLNEAESISALERGGKWAVSDSKGKPLTAFIYDEIRAYGGNSYAIAVKLGKKGVLSKSGVELVPFIFDEITNTKGDLLKLTQDGKRGLAQNKDGKVIYPCIYQDFYYPKNEYIPIMLNDKWGVGNLKGEIIVDFKYKRIDIVGDSFIVQNEDGLYGLINKKGEVVLPFDYDDIQGFAEKFVFARKKEMYRW